MTEIANVEIAGIYFIYHDISHDDIIIYFASSIRGVPHRRRLRTVRYDMYV